MQTLGGIFYRDPKVVEKQREALSVDRLPSALTTTASKSVQVNGAATVRVPAALPAPGRRGLVFFFCVSLFSVKSGLLGFLRV